MTTYDLPPINNVRAIHTEGRRLVAPEELRPGAVLEHFEPINGVYRFDSLRAMDRIGPDPGYIHNFGPSKYQNVDSAAERTPNAGSVGGRVIGKVFASSLKIGRRGASNVMIVNESAIRNGFIGLILIVGQLSVSYAQDPSAMLPPQWKLSGSGPAPQGNAFETLGIDRSLPYEKAMESTGGRNLVQTRAAHLESRITQAESKANDLFRNSPEKLAEVARLFSVIRGQLQSMVNRLSDPQSFAAEAKLAAPASPVKAQKPAHSLGGHSPSDKKTWPSKNIPPPTIKGYIGATFVAFAVHYGAKFLYYLTFEATPEERAVMADFLTTDFGHFLLSSFTVVSQKVINLFIGGTSQILVSLSKVGRNHPHRALLVGSLLGGYLNQRVNRAFEFNKEHAQTMKACSFVVERTAELEKAKAQQTLFSGKETAMNAQAFDAEYARWAKKRDSCREEMISHFWVTLKAFKTHSPKDFVQITEQTAKIYVTWLAVGMAKRALVNTSAWFTQRTLGISTRAEIIDGFKKGLMIEGAETANLARGLVHEVNSASKKGLNIASRSGRWTKDKLSSLGLIALGVELPDYANRGIFTRLANRFFVRYGTGFWNTLWFLWAAEKFDALMGWVSTTANKNTLNLQIEWTDSEIESNTWFRKSDLQLFTEYQADPKKYVPEDQKKLLEKLDETFDRVDAVWENYRSLHIRSELDAQVNEFSSEIKARQLFLHQRKNYYHWFDRIGGNPDIAARRDSGFTDNGQSEDKVPWHLPEFRMDELEMEIGTFYSLYTQEIVNNSALRMRFNEHMAKVRSSVPVGPMQKESTLLIQFFLQEAEAEDQREIEQLERKRVDNVDRLVRQTYFERKSPSGITEKLGHSYLVSFLNRSVNLATRHIPFENPYNLRDSYVEQLKYYLRLGIELRNRFPNAYNDSREFRSTLDHLWNWWVAYKSNKNPWARLEDLRAGINELSFINIGSLKRSLEMKKNESGAYLANSTKNKWSIFGRLWAIHLYDVVTSLQRSETEFWTYKKAINSVSQDFSPISPRLKRAFAIAAKLSANAIDKTIGEGEDAIKVSEAKMNDALGESKKVEERTPLELRAQQIHDAARKAEEAVTSSAKKHNVDEAEELDAKTKARHQATEEMFFAPEPPKANSQNAPQTPGSGQEKAKSVTPPAEEKKP